MRRMSGMPMPTPLLSMPKSLNIPGPPPRIALKVLDVQSNTGGLFRVRLEPLPMDWYPGDCVAVYEPDSSISRPYSLSGGKGEPWTELFIRKIANGRLSPWLTSRQPGDVIEVSPPFGWFRPAEATGGPKLFLATGSGIAPFWSAWTSGLTDPVEIRWGLRHVEDVFEHPANTASTISISQGDAGGYRSGRITDGLYKIELPSNLHVYACGVDRMIEESKKILTARGLPESNFHQECFFSS